MGNLVVYGSDQTHSALQKAAQIAGIHPKNFRVIKTTKSTAFGLCPNSLRAAIHEDVQAGFVPFFLCATVGTTSTNAIDPIGPLCEVAKDYSIWVHVGGFQLAQLVKSLVVEQGTWVQIPPTPKTNWCLGLMVRAITMSGRHKFKCYRNYQKYLFQ